MRHDAAFLAVCRALPPGHWHCKHGHVADCPEPLTCPRLAPDLEPRAYVVLAGRACWIYPSAVPAELQVQVLRSGGAQVTYRRGLSAVQVDLLVASLPGDAQVADYR